MRSTCRPRLWCCEAYSMASKEPEQNNNPKRTLKRSAQAYVSQTNFFGCFRRLQVAFRTARRRRESGARPRRRTAPSRPRDASQWEAGANGNALRSACALSCSCRPQPFCRQGQKISVPTCTLSTVDTMWCDTHTHNALLASGARRQRCSHSMRGRTVPLQS